jgi:integrase
VHFAEVGRRYLTHLETLGRKRSTLGEYESMFRVHLEPRFGEKPIDRITPDDIEHYIAAKLRDGRSPKTVRNHLGLLHSIFTFAERRGWARENPCKRVDAPAAAGASQDIRFLDQHELAALLRAVDDAISRVSVPASGRSARSESRRRMHQLDRVLFQTAALTGLRRGELLALRWRDVDWLASRIRVRRSWVRNEDGHAEVTPVEPRRPARATRRRVARAALPALELPGRRRPRLRGTPTRARRWTGRSCSSASRPRAGRPGSAMCASTICATPSAPAWPRPGPRCERCRSGWVTAISRRR